LFKIQGKNLLLYIQLLLIWRYYF